MLVLVVMFWHFIAIKMQKQVNNCHVCLHFQSQTGSAMIGETEESAQIWGLVTVEFLLQSNSSPPTPIFMLPIKIIYLNLLALVSESSIDFLLKRQKLLLSNQQYFVIGSVSNQWRPLLLAVPVEVNLVEFSDFVVVFCTFWPPQFTCVSL